MSETIVLQNIEENAIITTFNITANGSTGITLKNLDGMTKIDWGDGTVNTELNHTYENFGEYICKIYDVTSIGSSAFSDSGCHNLKEIVIPDNVTSIGDSAFAYCSNLTSVDIGGGVMSIGSEAFCWCDSLTNAVIGNSVTSIGHNAFTYCRSLTSVVIPDSVTSIDYCAFKGCGGLTSITIPGGVTNIGIETFSSCSNLTSVTIGDGVPSIVHRMFAKCSSLTSIKLPNSVTSIEREAFLDCSSLAGVDIGDSVTSISYDAFQGCSSLKSIVIPDSTTSICEGAFNGCSSLSSVTFKNKTPISATMLTDTAINTTTTIFYVPVDSVEAYQTAWAGVVLATQIQVELQVDLNERLVTLGSLKEYHKNLKEYIQQYIRDNFAALMAEYLNSAEAAENKPTATEISSVFEEEEA